MINTFSKQIITQHLICIQYNVDDEFVILSALATNSSSRSMVIFDARSAIAASGNQLKVWYCIEALHRSRIKNFLKS